jgi:hypothetical protein
MKFQIALIALSILCVSSSVVKRQAEVFETVLGPCTKIYIAKEGDTCAMLEEITSTNFKQITILNYQTNLFKECDPIPTGKAICLETANAPLFASVLPHVESINFD